MLGIQRRPGGGGADLAYLRKSVIWSSTTNNSTLRGQRGALQERLEEILVLELHKDGGRTYLSFTVRGLYKHVLAAITSKISGKRERDEVHAMVHPTGDVGTMSGDSGNGNGGGPSSITVMRDTLAAPVVLGILAVHPEDDGNSTTREHDDDSQSETPPAGAADDEMEVESGTSPPLVKSPVAPVHKNSRTSATPNTRPVPTIQPVSEVLRRADPVTYRERLGGYLHPRDMRRLVTPFSASNEPGLIVRRHAMLLNFDPLRAVILRDRLLVIVPDGADSILVQLEKRVRGGLMEMERSCLGATTHGASDDDMKYSEHSRSSGHPSAKNRMRKLLSKVPGSGEELPVSTNHSETPSETTEATHQLGDEYADAAAQADDEWNDLQGTEWIDLPFELQCTDAILHTVSAFLTGDTIELQEASLTYIQSILKDQTGSGDDPLTIIRAVKEAVREMSGRVKGFVQSMNRILDEDEDMALMNLSRLVTHPDRFMYPVTAEVLEEESDEPELILESYLQESLSLQNVLESIQGQIDTAAELVDQRLDSVRNRILMANMVLTAFSVSVSIASLVGSLFGMNVPVPYENDDSAFRKITFGTLSGTLGICFVILATLFYSGTIPRIGVASE